MGEKAVILFNLATLTEECAIEIFTERGLLPKKEPVPLCPNPNCGAKMKASMDRQRKLGWIWVCTNRHKTKCSSSISPLTNTFFENVKLSFRDVLRTMYLFVKKTKISEALEDIHSCP
ncbi:hypothetical protein AVEN_198955-1 [Araneus ventricosus]|uniref:Uncharacterized protein n=1 Tax=Araneus ventricosus TaxID=182803 RepID=A0A4Y2VYV6_ARAVE|nr:hypothetical protein AVEN_198955-1 [Araneus ventricosus]